MWFQYPIHRVDDVGSLKDIQPEGDAPAWKKNFTMKKSPDAKKKEQKEALETAYEACSIDEKITIKAIAEYMGVTEKTARNRIKEHGGFWVDDGVVGKKG
ncbi:hypothetical protein ACFSND_31245 [Brevibacillus brevis]